MGRIAFEGQIYHDISLHSIVGIAVNKPEEPVRNQDFDDHLEVSQNRGPQVTMAFQYQAMVIHDFDYLAYPDIECDIPQYSHNKNQANPCCSALQTATTTESPQSSSEALIASQWM